MEADDDNIRECEKKENRERASREYEINNTIMIIRTHIRRTNNGHCSSSLLHDDNNKI